MTEAGDAFRVFFPQLSKDVSLLLELLHNGTEQVAVKIKEREEEEEGEGG